ncbi:hypothetical protein [Nitrososphaera sp. AFS]|nr:hypothetical protein [Nitrososphaera sp. AFS]
MLEDIKLLDKLAVNKLKVGSTAVRMVGPSISLSSYDQQLLAIKII